MEITSSVTISRPRSEVFAKWSELERIPEWFDMSLERRKLTDAPVGVGATFHAVDRMPPGRKIEFTLEIVEFRPDEFMAATLSAPVNARWEVRLEETTDGTVMTMHSSARLGGLQRLLTPLLQGWAGKVQQRGLHKFRDHVEASVQGPS